MRRKIMFVMTTTLMTLALVACSNDNNLNESTNTEVVEQLVTLEDGTIANEAANDEMSAEETTDEQKEDVATNAAGAADILNNVWETYEEEEKFFAMGGDMNNPVENAAGTFGMEDVESLSASLYIPAESIELVDDAATLIHAMNANTFTGAAFHLVDAMNAELLANSLKQNILNTRWLCGFPDELIIFRINDEYVISALGNTEIIENFKNKVSSVYGQEAVVLVEEAITQ